MAAPTHGNSNGSRQRPHRPDTRWPTAVVNTVGAVPGGLRRLYDYSMFVLLVGLVIALAIVLEPKDQIVALKIFVIGYFSLLPAILYLQFTARKTPTVWREYVVNLFRLHADDYAALPEPPRVSSYHDLWEKDRKERVGELEDEHHKEREENNIYRRRFEELYGPVPSAGDSRRRVRLERAHKLQVLMATLLIALGWVFVVQPDSVFNLSIPWSHIHLTGLPAIPHESFSFAFLGSYFFVLQMLVRRFFQNDLKATAYLTTTMRIIIVVLLVWVLDPVLATSIRQNDRSAIAFVIGVFPSVGWAALQSIVAVLLKRAVPALDSKHPLSGLDGMNVWYEARLVEEGVEDIQNLATTDIGNVLLRTRIPPERLIDWLDQALLGLHTTGLTDEDQAKLSRQSIRSATDLLEALAYRRPEANGKTFAAGIERLLNEGDDGPSVTLAIAVALQGERNLQHVLCWRSFTPSPKRGEETVLTRALAPA